jgi:hypothetical protein
MIINIWDGKLRIEEYVGKIKMTTSKSNAIMNNCSSVYKDLKTSANLRFHFGGNKAILHVSLYTWPLVRNAIYLQAPNMKGGNGVIVNALSKYSMTIRDFKFKNAVPRFDAVRFNEVEEFYLDDGGYRKKKIMIAC